MATIKGRACGKINLFLEITGVREDGYHDINTVFQSVSLLDMLSISVNRGFGQRGGISLRTNRRYLPTDERNLAYRAALLFFESTGIKNPGLHINIKKTLPVGGGMAGGSTNAAAVLQMLNRYYRCPLDRQRLGELALSLGADVPFCLDGGTALAHGVGEVLSPLAPMPFCHIVICRPAVSVSTKKAYTLYDEMPGNRALRSAEGMAAALAGGSLAEVCGAMYNAFERPVFSAWPEIGRVKEQLLKVGAMAALMSGSGSAVFGVFADEGVALRAASRLKERYSDVFTANPVNKQIKTE